MRLGAHVRAVAVVSAVALLSCGGDTVSPATATESEGVTEGDDGTSSGGATEGDSTGATGETTVAADPAEDCPVVMSLGEVSVTGTTPYGDFSGSYAAYGYKAGDCLGGILIAIVSDPGLFLEQVSQPADSYFSRPLPFDGVLLSVDRDAVDTGTDNELFVEVFSGDESVWGTGAATLTSVDWTPWDDYMGPPTDPWAQAQGHFIIDDAGISLAGTFVAPLCGWLSGAC